MPVYQNLEYKAWKRENMKGVPKSCFDLSFEQTSTELSERGTPSRLRRNASEPNVTTPKLLEEIRHYFTSSKSTPDSFGSYVSECKQSETYRKKELEQVYEVYSYMPYYVSAVMQSQSYYNSEVGGSKVLTGRIKFFDSMQNYGFFTLDCDGSDLFVHYEDFLKAGLNKDDIQMAKSMNVWFRFRKFSYYGKYNLSTKAIDIQTM
jgi:cold shock CspA family protein